MSVNEDNLTRYTKRFSNSVRENELATNKKSWYTNKKIPLNKTKKFADYSDSNIIDFLSFINNSICIPEYFRVVCHSHIMKDFIEKIDEKKYKNLKNEGILEENLWTIFLTLKDNKRISISRHGFSNANLIKEKGKLDKGLFKKLLTIKNQSSEIDAKLSIYGVLTTLLHGDDLHKKEIKNEMNESPITVFVSVLIRTWMTAICLYLPYCNNNKFILIVSPFIKEKGMGLDNKPEPFDTQIHYITNFLDYLIKISNITFTKDIINNNLKKIKEYFQKGNVLIINNSNKNEIVTFKLDENNERIKSIKEYTTPYFNNKNYTCNDIFDIDMINIFHGETKPNKNDIKLKFSKWCEPFSREKESYKCGEEIVKENPNNLKSKEALTEKNFNKLNFNNLTFRETLTEKNFNNSNFNNLTSREALTEIPRNN